jgi:hypothetical protein
MKKLLMALAALPVMANAAAAAGQPLNDRQMDKVTAGFSAVAIADAQGLVGALETVLTTTATLTLVTPYATASWGGTALTIYDGSAAQQPSALTSTILPLAIPGLGRGM